MIAATWTAHHMLFVHVSRTNPPLITLNLMALFGYVLIPWASKTLGEVPNGAGVVVYSAAMAFLGGTMLLIVRHVVRSGLLDPGAPRGVISGIRIRAFQAYFRHRRSRIPGCCRRTRRAGSARSGERNLTWHFPAVCGNRHLKGEDGISAGHAQTCPWRERVIAPQQ
ncbi:hypothetical protein [Streptosporangium sp. NPDC000396]|uniref:hypothetical protein n=1 Tax=Streptosporangium sp. NPDC000396 TaxID=3366185 RepID=UPI0036D00EB9